MKFYIYRSPLGIFIVKPHPNGRWGLWFKDDLLGFYESAVAAADDVYSHATGDYDWDSYDSLDVPTDIHEWEVVAR